MKNKILLLLLVAMMSSSPIEARNTHLPKGIGMYLYGYRQFAPQTHTYKSDGRLAPLAEPLQKDFNGPQLLEGAGGSQLKELARHLQKFDSYSEAENSLLNGLRLGQLNGHVDGQISGQSFGLGFGMTNNLTAMIAVPYIQAHVRTDIQFSGQNNAQEIKQRLGALAYRELQQGLDQATMITTNQIKQTIESEGYAPIDEWSYNGLGDITLGAIYGFSSKTGYRNLKSNTAFETTLTIPTGYVNDPNVLTDTGIGRGYYSLGGKIRQFFTLNERFVFSGMAGVGLNTPTKMQARVPEEDEAIIAYDRLTTVDLVPGHDFMLAGTVGLQLSSWYFSTTVGKNTHQRDRYSGPIEGNYDALGAASENSIIYQDFGVSFDTVTQYEKKSFPVPFILAARYQMPLAAVNHMDERYFEVSISSFFMTPMAAPLENDSVKTNRRSEWAHNKKNKNKNRGHKKNRSVLQRTAHH